MEDIPAVEDILAVEEGSLAAVEDIQAAAENPAGDNQAAEHIPAAGRAEAEQILENKCQVRTQRQNGWHYNDNTFTLLVLFHSTGSSCLDVM